MQVGWGFLVGEFIYTSFLLALLISLSVGEKREYVKRLQCILTRGVFKVFICFVLFVLLIVSLSLSLFFLRLCCVCVSISV